MKSHSYLACALLAAAIAGCGPGAPAPTEPTSPTAATGAAAEKSGVLRYFEVFNTDVRDVPTMIALDELRAMGYTVERTGLDSTSLIAEALVRGDADLASANNQTMWSAIVEGAEVRTFMQRTGSTLVVIAGRDIETCADLDGRPFGMAVLTGQNPALLQLYLDQNCPGTELEQVTLADRSGRVAALLAGELDAALLQLEDFQAIEREAPGEFYLLARLYKDFSDVQVNGAHVRSVWAQQNPELLADFIRALLGVHRRIAADPDELYVEAAQRLELDPADARETADLYLGMDLWDANGALTRENLQYTLDFLIGLETLPPDLTVDDVADLSYLDAVLAEIGRQ